MTPRLYLPELVRLPAQCPHLELRGRPPQRGTPEILPDAENLAVLDRLVEHFEQVLPDPHLLHATGENSDYANRIVQGTVGGRLRVTHIEAKEKMNQDKPAESVRTILRDLRGEGPYANPALAERMECVNAEKLAGDRPGTRV